MTDRNVTLEAGHERTIRHGPKPQGGWVRDGIITDKAPTRVIVSLGSISSPVGVSLADYNGDWTAAIAAAQTRGKVVNVPAGTWTAYRIFPNYDGCVLRGAGVGQTIVPRNASQPGLDVGGFIHVVHANVTIEGMTLRGWTGPSDDILINGRDATGLRVLWVAIENAKGCGIQLQGQHMTGALIEDVKITNTTYRSNGYHGVALWPYNGASGNIYRRVTIDGADFAGIMLDAGTESGPALGVNDNTFTDIIVRRAARKLAPGGVRGAGWFVTGAARNRVDRWEVTDQPIGPAVAFGFDQSGLGSPDNTFTTGLIARIASGDAISFGGTGGNLFDGGSGSGRVLGRAGNTIVNWPELN